jgi:hypothetical protein
MQHKTEHRTHVVIDGYNVSVTMTIEEASMLVAILTRLTPPLINLAFLSDFTTNDDLSLIDHDPISTTTSLAKTLQLAIQDAEETADAGTSDNYDRTASERQVNVGGDDWIFDRHTGRYTRRD